MNQVRPFEIDHLPNVLKAAFSTRITSNSYGSAEERERNFLTRALACYAILKLTGCTVDDAADSLVDGGGDGGIDAIYYSPTAHQLFIVQSKFIANGRGEPSLGDVLKFKMGVENLMSANWDAFNDNSNWQRRLPAIRQQFSDSALQIRAILVYSGVSLISDDRLQLFEDIKRRFSSEDDYFTFTHYNLTSVHDWITGADSANSVDEVALTIKKPGWITQPYETIYGYIHLDEISRIVSDYGKKVIASNIRAYKGRTEVNKHILRTIKDEPTNFFYLNNGLTAYCDRLEVNHTDRANADKKRITAFGFSIINGAQTLGAIHHHFKNNDTRSEGRVFIKIISLEKCIDESKLAVRIAQSTNFQNEVLSRDFVALDERQHQMARQLALSNIYYHVRASVDNPAPNDNNFDLVEATTAMACTKQQSDCDFTVRCLCNRQSLWSLEQVYVGTEEQQSRYGRIFKQDLSARTVWRAVQTQRIVIKRMQENGSAATGPRKLYFENARWLILNTIFLKYPPEKGDMIDLSVEEKTAIAIATDNYAEVLWDCCLKLGFVSRTSIGDHETYQLTKHFRSVFSSKNDCMALREKILSKLNG